MLIFDNFSSREMAEKFVKAVAERYEVRAEVHDSLDGIDVFKQIPVHLPIVYVSMSAKDRDSYRNRILKTAREFGGMFAF